MSETGFLPFIAWQVIPGKGVIMMRSKPLKSRIGPVTVKPLGENRFQLAWMDPASGSYVRRRIEATHEQAEQAAFKIGSEILSDRGFLPPGKKRVSTPSIREAISEAVRLGGGNAYTKTDLGRKGAAFVRWIEESHPRIKAWEDLKPFHVREYVRHLEGLGLAPDSIRLRLVPVKSAWKHCSENYDIRPLPKIKLPTSAPQVVTCFDAPEVAVLLHFLRRVHPILGGIATLQALAGLRVLEAAYLRRSDVDLERGIVRIRETPLHKPKNQSSHREIPVCSEVLETLEEAFQRQRVIPLDGGGELFLTVQGNPWHVHTLSKRFRELLDLAADETGLPIFRELPVRKLRASFSTLASSLGADTEALRRYLGHAGTGILERHYMLKGEDDLRGVSNRLEGWRNLLSGGQDCKIIATPEKRGAVNG